MSFFLLSLLGGCRFVSVVGIRSLTLGGRMRILRLGVLLGSCCWCLRVLVVVVVGAAAVVFYFGNVRPQKG
jgi:hypothetical protein